MISQAKLCTIEAMSTEPNPRIAARRVAVNRIESVLRAALALPVVEPAPGENLPSLSRAPLPEVVRIDAPGWLDWALRGLRVFSLPSESDWNDGTDTRESTEGTHASENTEGSAAHLAAALLSLASLAGAAIRDEPEPFERDETRRRPWVPSIRLAVAEARQAVMGLAMARHRGNLTRIAESFETSRRALREHLKRAGLYTAPPRSRKAKASSNDASTIDADAAKGGE